jgi:hypothetical protein
MYNYSMQWRWFCHATYSWYPSRAGLKVQQVRFLLFIMLSAPSVSLPLSLSLCLPPLLFLYISLSLSMFSLGFTFLPYSGHSGSESRSETKLLNKNRLTYKFLNMILSINIIRHLISQSDLTSWTWIEKFTGLLSSLALT